MPTDDSFYNYKAKCIKVIDGDTLELEIDLGLNILTRERVRLFGINTHEIFGVKIGSDEYNLGMKSKTRVEELVSGKEVSVTTIKDKKEKYGRYLAKIYIDGVCLNDLLVSEGLAVIYLV